MIIQSNNWRYINYSLAKEWRNEEEKKTIKSFIIGVEYFRASKNLSRSFSIGLCASSCKSQKAYHDDDCDNNRSFFAMGRTEQLLPGNNTILMLFIDEPQVQIDPKNQEPGLLHSVEKRTPKHSSVQSPTRSAAAMRFYEPSFLNGIVARNPGTNSMSPELRHSKH
jgi:hypothetical protein